MEGRVIFLRKLCPGGVAHSFGIHVARLAGMPSDVVCRAEKKLRELEENAQESRGWLSQSWIQEEQLHVDLIPSNIKMAVGTTVKG